MRLPRRSDAEPVVMAPLSPGLEARDLDVAEADRVEIAFGLGGEEQRADAAFGIRLAIALGRGRLDAQIALRLAVLHLAVEVEGIARAVARRHGDAEAQRVCPRCVSAVLTEMSSGLSL